jgi:hypothetical protein
MGDPITPEAVERWHKITDDEAGADFDLIGSMVPDATGEWVRASDYDALAHELAEAKTDILNLRKSANTLEREQDEARAKTLTADKLANAFDAVWNAAIGESHRQQDGIVFASILAESFRAMSAALKGDLSGR